MQLYYIFKRTLDAVIALLFMYLWIAGVVLANGWMKLLAVFFFPYAWYLFIAKYLMP